MNLNNREKIILAITGGIVIVGIYVSKQLSQSDQGNSLSNVITALIDDAGFIVLCALLILALVFLPVGL